MSEEASELSFDRAIYAHAEGATPRSQCKKSLESEYWTWQSQLLCGNCRAHAQRTFADAQTTVSFGKAILWGGLTAVGCGIAYERLLAKSPNSEQAALAHLCMAERAARDGARAC